MTARERMVRVVAETLCKHYLTGEMPVEDAPWELGWWPTFAEAVVAALEAGMGLAFEVSVSGMEYVRGDGQAGLERSTSLPESMRATAEDLARVRGGRVESRALTDWQEDDA